MTVLFIFLLMGCEIKADKYDENLSTSTEQSAPMLSKEIYKALKKNWNTYDALSTERKMLFSTMPGFCVRYFDTWEECEKFIGIDISNPLESSTQFEKCTWAAMPIGYSDDLRFQVSWNGTRDGHIEHITITGGYRFGQIRIMMDTTLTPEKNSTVWPSGAEKLKYLENESNGIAEITQDGTENYFANSASFLQDYVSYNIRVIGEQNAQSDVRKVLEQALSYFFDAE